MELLRTLSEKKCLLEGRIHTQLCNALYKIVHNMPSEVISQSPNTSQEEAYDFASSRLDLMEHLFTSVLTNISNYEADTSNSSNAEPNTAPSAVVQTETNGAINEGPVEENVIMPVVISNQETQIDTVSAGVTKETQTLEGAVAQQEATNVPAAEQLAVELLDRNQETQQDPIKTVTVTPGDVKEEPTVENTVEHVVTITTVTTRPQTEELEDVLHDSYENATLLPATSPSAVVQTEANRLTKDGSVKENVTVSVAIPNQETQTVTVSVGVAKEEKTLEGAAVQQVATNVLAADQLAVELLDRSQQTQKDVFKTVTITPGDVIEPAVENTVQHVVPITTLTTWPQTEELEDVHHDSYENATLHPATPNEQILDISTPAAEETEPTVNIEQTNFRRSGRVSRKRRLSVSSNHEPQPKKNTRRSAPAQQAAATRSKSRRRSRGGPCPECGKVFMRSDVLTKHLHTHTGEKPFRCIWTGCGFRAGDRSIVTQHVRVMHLNLPRTKKVQRERGIVDERDEKDYIIKVEQQD